MARRSEYGDMCERCRSLIARASRVGVAKARARGVHVGRPRIELTAADLARVTSGDMTAEQLALRLGVCVATVRRRLRELRRQQ